MEVLHFRLLGLVVKDWQMLFPKDMLNTLERELFLVSLQIIPSAQLLHIHSSLFASSNNF